MEGVLSGLRLLIPHQEVPVDKESSFRAGHEHMGMECDGPVGRGEQLARRRADRPHLQGRRPEGPSQLRPDQLPPNHHIDDKSCHPQEYEKMTVRQL